MKISFNDDVLNLISQNDIEVLKQKFMTHKLTKLFDDEQVVSYCKELFNNNLNVSLTAEKVYMHRNTLSYKLNKIYRLTNLDLRNFNDAFIFKVLLEIYSKRV